ncbi:hypothetical protein DFP72DRAFT_1064602 [Ephemerocybe angulata]|uniref:Uncharacterized protein n=1 Tax=Ephemerocybe angulata TaxID=980116 RepID=A0A8H6I5X0_9AGAR|nr:hypothetical protein DFP72DRAFT_1064602 [Tulosesus angulatus]
MTTLQEPSRTEGTITEDTAELLRRPPARVQCMAIMTSGITVATIDMAIGEAKGIGEGGVGGRTGHWTLVILHAAEVGFSTRSSTKTGRKFRRLEQLGRWPGTHIERSRV